MTKRSTNRKELEQELTSYSTTAKSTLARRKARKATTKRACVAFGAATSAALVAGTALEAGIIYTDIADIVITVTGGTTTGIDIDGGGIDFLFYHSGTNTVYGFGASPGDGIVRNTGGAAIPYAANNLIGTPGSTFPGGVASSIGFFVNSGFPSTNFAATAFAGVTLSGGNFGWIRVQKSPTSFTIFDFAYDDMGNHIVAGAGAVAAVPEPTSAALFMGLGLISMGAGGVRELRRRKREAAANATDEHLSA